MRKLSAKIRILLGIFSLVIGLAGLVLPILQGWLFIAVGFALLSRDVPFFRRLQERLERRFPKLAEFRKAAMKRFGGDQE